MTGVTNRRTFDSRAATGLRFEAPLLALILELCYRLAAQGLDAGSDTIAWHLEHHHHIAAATTPDKPGIPQKIKRSSP